MHAHSLSRRHTRRWRHGHGGDEGRHSLHRFFHHGRGGRSVRRGKVRLAILSVLRAQPMHGYQVIQELESRSRGRWRPSAGSIYPTLQLLEDEGLVSSAEVDGRRVYSLTDAGRTVAEEQAPTPEALLDGGPEGEPSLPELAGRLIAAAAELERIGTDAARAAGRTALVDTRKRLYRLLAEDEDDPPAGT
jgi:DNA-binding PadR family transcriptional regulator